MDKLIEALPQFIMSIVLGFVFIRVFRYMCSIKNSDEYEHIIWESLLVGFILKTGFSVIPFSINQPIDSLGMVLTTILLSGILAKIYSKDWIDKILRKFGIHRTRHKYIWQDIEDEENVTLIKAINPETKEMYYGALKYYEDFERNPQIILQYFQYWENNECNTPTLDFSDDPKCVVMIDTEKFSQIYAVYQSNSKKVTLKD